MPKSPFLCRECQNLGRHPWISCIFKFRESLCPRVFDSICWTIGHSLPLNTSLVAEATVAYATSGVCLITVGAVASWISGIALDAVRSVKFVGLQCRGGVTDRSHGDVAVAGCMLSPALRTVSAIALGVESFLLVAVSSLFKK